MCPRGKVAAARVEFDAVFSGAGADSAFGAEVSGSRQNRCGRLGPAVPSLALPDTCPCSTSRQGLSP